MMRRVFTILPLTVSALCLIAGTRTVPSVIGTATQDQLSELTDDRPGAISSELHHHSFDDIRDPRGVAACVDNFSIPKHGIGQDPQISGEPDRWCDLLSTLSDGSYIINFDSAQLWSFEKRSSSNTGVPALTVKMFAEDGALGNHEGLRVELDIEDVDVTARGGALKVAVTPSDVDYAYPDIYVARMEEDVGVNARAFRASPTRETSITTTAFYARHGNIVNAMDIGENNVITSCDDRFDTGTPQTSCAGSYLNSFPFGCPDSLCDVDGTTATPDEESFSASDFEVVLSGASVDNADGQHTHTGVKSWGLFDPATGDSDKIQWAPAKAITITKVWCSTNAGTVTIMPDERAEATPNTQGVDILSAALICDITSHSSCASGCDVNTINNGSIDAYDPVSLDIDAVSTATFVRIHLEYAMTGL